MADVNKIIGGIRALGGDEAVEEARSRCPAFEAADGVGTGHETLRQLALWLLAEGNSLNIMHWNVKGSYKHGLLGDAYELCRSTGDELAETYMAKTGKTCLGVVQQSRVETVATDTAILSKLRELDAHMNDAAAKNPKFTEGVKDIFAEFDRKMTGIIYKYSQFEY